jgi:hypothetical protein
MGGCDVKKFLTATNVARVALLFFVSPVLAGCFGNFIPSLQEPTRLFTSDQELDNLRNAQPKISLLVPAEAQRNELIAERMYGIDINYTLYESQLTHESQDVGFLTTLTNLGLTGTAALIPVAQTSRILSGAAAGITGSGAAYNEKILMSNLVQNLETQMRTDRNDQAAIIYQNMKCNITNYPLGMALSDLEVYYRAGTLPSALIGLSKTVSKAETDSKASKDSNAPAAPAAAKAQLTMAASVSTAKAKPSSPNTNSCNG